MIEKYLRISGWIGIGVMFLAAILALRNSWGITHPIYRLAQRGDLSFYPYFALVGFVGLFFILIGGLLTIPRYFRLVSMIVSSIYIISFFGLIPNLYIIANAFHGHRFFYLLSELSFIPIGLAGIIQGLILKRIENIRPSVDRT
jgi:hypothetical protein